MDNLKIRLATKSDLTEVAEIHKKQFSDHYLGQFSVKLLERFYNCFFSQDTIFIVSEANGVINGFIVGGKLSLINECTSLFIKNNIILYISEIFFRPHTWIKSVKKFFDIILRRKVQCESLDATMDFTLLSIAVAPNYLGRNVAKSMILYFDEIMSNYTDAYFLSVRENNIRAIKFYLKMGFKIERCFDGECQLIKKI